MIERAGYLDPAVEQRRQFHRQLVLGGQRSEIQAYPRDLHQFFHIEDCQRNLIAPPYPLLTWGVEHIQYCREQANEISAPMIERKIFHTKHVMETIYKIGQMSGFFEDLYKPVSFSRQDTARRNRDTLLVTGLFHDEFRFDQALKYGTFKDSKSFDHADMAAEAIMHARLPFALCGISESICVNAVAQHSQLETPSEEVAQLIRDADKLVIMKEFMRDQEILIKKGESKQSLDKQALNQLLNGQVITHSETGFLPVNRTLQRISWINDLNFQATRSIAHEERLFEKLFDQLTVLSLDYGLAEVEQYISSHSFNGMYAQEFQPVL